jgi:hypothetical protein
MSSRRTPTPPDFPLKEGKRVRRSSSQELKRLKIEPEIIEEQIIPIIMDEEFETRWTRELEKIEQEEELQKRIAKYNLKTVPPEIIKNIGQFIPDVKDLSRFRASHPYVYKNINTPISTNTNKILSSDRLIQLGVKAIVQDLKQFTHQMIQSYQEIETIHPDFFDEASASYGAKFLLLNEFTQLIQTTPQNKLESIFSKALKKLYKNASDEVKNIDDPYTKVKDFLYIVKNKTNPVLPSISIKNAFAKTPLQILFLEEDELEWHYWDLLRHSIFPNTLNTLHFSIVNSDDPFYNPVEVVSKPHTAFNYEDYVNDFQFTTYQQNSEENSDGQYEYLLELFEEMSDEMY